MLPIEITCTRVHWKRNEARSNARPCVSTFGIASKSPLKRGGTIVPVCILYVNY